MGIHSRGTFWISKLDLNAASWACPRLGPFLRQAIGLAVRCGLARAVNETYRKVPLATLLAPPCAPLWLAPQPPRVQRDTSLRSQPSSAALPAAATGPGGPAHAQVVL